MAQINAAARPISRVRPSRTGRPAAICRRGFAAFSMMAGAASVTAPGLPAARVAPPRSSLAGGAYRGASVPVLLIHGAATPASGNSTMAPDCATSIKTPRWFEMEAGGDGCDWTALRRLAYRRSVNAAHFQMITEGYFYN